MKKTSAGKVDRGFALAYMSLSYRRKMLRSFWLLPTCLVFPFLPKLPNDNFVFRLYNSIDPWVIAAVVFLGTLLQIAYNYYMWQKHEVNAAPLG